MRLRSTVVSIVLAAATIAAVAVPARAQTGVAAPAETAPPQEPPLSRECQTPGLAMSGGVSLPNVTRAIRERKVIKILAIGASAKGGRGLNENGYYGIIEAVLEKTIPGLDVQMIDRGVSGELARDAAERIRTEVALVNPDLVLWQLGTHDAMMQVPVEDFKVTVGESLDWLRQRGVDVVIVGLHYLRKLATDPHYQAIRIALNRLADEKKVLRIGRYEAMQVIEQARQAGSPGTKHPNEFAATEAGYSCLSEYVARALTSGVFARPPRGAQKGG